MSYVIDSYTKLLIPFDGTDADTADQTAATGQTISLEGNACLDTAQKKFGAASLLLDGTGDYATVPDSTDWYFAANPFTIDFWVYLTASTSQQGLCGQYVDANNYWALYYGINSLYFDVVVGGVTKASHLCSFSAASNLNAWHHIEVMRNGENIRFFIDGTIKNISYATQISSNEVPNLAAVLEIGASHNHSKTLIGRIDEVRISKGIARHTASFIPPNEASFLELF